MAETQTLIPEWTLADKLRKAREAAGYKNRAEEFAEVVGITRNTVSNYENGHTRPRLLEIRAWAAATGVDPAWLEASWVKRARKESNLRPLDYIAAPWAWAGLRLIQTDAPGRVTRRLKPRRRLDTERTRTHPVRRHLEAA